MRISTPQLLAEFASRFESGSSRRRHLWLDDEPPRANRDAAAAGRPRAGFGSIAIR